VGLSPGQTKDYKIGISCFSANHAAVRKKGKMGLLWIRIQCPRGARRLLFQWVSTI